MTTKMRLRIFAIAFLALADDAAAETFKNANGQVVGRSVTNNAGTTYYDASGRNTGRSTTNNTGTTFYDASGRQTGRSTTK